MPIINSERNFTNEVENKKCGRKLEGGIRLSLNWLYYKGPGHGNSWIRDLEVNMLHQRTGLHKKKCSERMYIKV